MAKVVIAYCSLLDATGWYSTSAVLAQHSPFKSPMVSVYRIRAGAVHSGRRIFWLALLRASQLPYFKFQVFISTNSYCTSDRSFLVCCLFLDFMVRIKMIIAMDNS